MNYTKVNAANYSTLSKLAVHPVLAYDALTKPERESAFFDIGNYVDEGMYGNPMDTHMVIEDSAIPNYDTKTREVAEFVLKTIKEGQLEPTESLINDMIISATNVVGYYPNWKPETRLEKLKPLVETYINVVTTSQYEGKSLITVSQRELADTLIHNIKHSERFINIVNDCEIRYQHDMYFTYTGVSPFDGSFTVQCKILPDFLLINEKKKEIRILDIKTYQGSFIENYFKYRYFYQGSFYSYGASRNFEGYHVLNPVFVAADKSLKMPVRVFEQTDWKDLWSKDVYHVAGGRKYKTLPNLLLEYEFHSRTGDWSESYEAINCGTEKLTLL